MTVTTTNDRGLPTLHTSPASTHGSCHPFIDETGAHEQLRTYGEKCRPTLLIGETGVGKTTLIRQVAASLRRKLIQKLGGKFPSSKLVGHYQLKATGGATATEFEEGPLVRALKIGAIFYLDEIDNLSDDIHDLLHPVLDERRALSLADVGLLTPGESEVIEAAPNFWFVASCVDKSRLPEDFLDRFRVIRLHRLGADAQIKKLTDDFSLSLHEVERLVRIGELTRKIGWQKPASFRQVLNAAQDVQDGIGMDEAIDINLINPNVMDEHDQVSLRNAMEREGLGSTRILADALVPAEMRPAPLFDVDSLDDHELIRDSSEEANIPAISPATAPKARKPRTRRAR